MQNKTPSTAPVMIEIQGVRKVYPSQAGQVVALDPHIGPQQTADIFQLLNRGGQHCQGNAGKLL